jgi:hypothetical protein
VRTLPLALAGAGLLAVAAPGSAAVSVRIDSVRVVAADTRRPAQPPYRRGRAYAYVVRYRIAGDARLRVTRRAELRTPGGTLIARIAPPATIEEPGRYFATSRIPVGRRDPRTVYVLRYAVAVRGRDDRALARRVVRLRFV